MEKAALLEYLTELRAERTALIDRVNVVLAAFKLKGGDPGEYEQYVKAVSGIKVDVSDASATWATVTGWLASAEGGLVRRLMTISRLRIRVSTTSTVFMAQRARYLDFSAVGET